MNKRFVILVLALAIFLWGCERVPETEPSETVTEVTEETEVTLYFPDGNPEDVTCKGTYTGEVAEAVVARIGDAELTNQQLQVWYWAEVAQWQQEKENGPDFSQPLDLQRCEMDNSVNSWQQFFLRKALERWHTAQALLAQSEEVPLATEEAYKPNLNNHEAYMTGQPATKYLYGYNTIYSPNTMHQEYLDTLGDTLTVLAQELGDSSADALAKRAFGVGEEELMAYAHTLNKGYMYFTQLSYSVAPTEEELAEWMEESSDRFSSQEPMVDIRHVLLIPEGMRTEEDWAACQAEANKLLKEWKSNIRCSEGTFAALANKKSADSGTALDGGGYQGIRKGQLLAELDAWCFDPSREVGDTAVISSQLGVHILYYSRGYTEADAQAEEAYNLEKQEEILKTACQAYPMEVDYSLITLVEGEAALSVADILYPDIAHERFPEVPLYLQQDYPDTMYGNYRIVSNGCGITTMAMLATYMTDDELTPPEMCRRFGKYSHFTGTDCMIFVHEPAGMGFYLKEHTYNRDVARAALEEGRIVISLQYVGYWTRAGHYIVCESINEDGMVQVRDSNIYNYGRLNGHKEDLHTWASIIANGSGYWIFEEKITRIPACSRCGTGEGEILQESYLCRKCDPAVRRRNTYLKGEER